MGSGTAQFHFLFLTFELVCPFQELGLIRKPAAFISTISDERGQELLYAGMRISDVFKEDIGLGGVVSLLWFKRREHKSHVYILMLTLPKVCPLTPPSSLKWS